MIGSRFAGIAVRKSEIAASGPPSARLRGPPATTGAANRPSLMLLSRQYPITANYVNPGLAS